MEVTVPCGRCIGCRLDYSAQWATRCVHEAQLHQANSFITLTYNDEHLPKDHSIHKEELQKFFKRIRKNTGQKLRYFACGEYGEKNNRPHYHAIIFGYDFPDKTLWSKSKSGELIFRSKELERAWSKEGEPIGHAAIGSVTFNSAAYVARYAMKKRKGTQEEKDEHYKILDKETGEIYQLEPEFCLMSRRPGLGKEWLEKYKTDTNKDYVTVERAIRKLPKYYDNILEIEDGDAMLVRKKKRRKEARRREHDNTLERLNAKETVKEAQVKQLNRGYENEA